MRVIRKAALFMPEVFGFAVIALVIAAGSCRFNRVRAEIIVYPNPCSEQKLRETWGDDWHIGFMLNGCWMYEPSPWAEQTPVRCHMNGKVRICVIDQTATPRTPVSRQFVIGGR